MKFIDTSKVGTTRKTQDGYLVADVLTARTGIQLYHSSELDLADKNCFFRVYRPEDQVFDTKSLASYAHKPITDNHPSEAVTADNWKDLAHGTIGDEVARDGDYVRVPLIIMDAELIAKVEAGKVELSAGYLADVEFTAGTTPDGQTYDAIQKNIRINHVAVVDRGRAGSKARIGDNSDHWGATPFDDTLAKDERKNPMTKIILVDGLQVETTDAGAAAIEKLQKQIGTLTADAATTASTHAAALAAKDTEIGGLKVELKKAQDAIPAADALDKLVADRVNLIGKAKTVVADIKTEGVSDADIKKVVVAKKLGDDVIKDASPAMIDGMFIALTKDAKAAPATGHDPLAGFVPAPIVVGDEDAGQSKYEGRLKDAWKSNLNKAGV